MAGIMFVQLQLYVVRIDASIDKQIINASHDILVHLEFWMMV